MAIAWRPCSARARESTPYNSKQEQALNSKVVNCCSVDAWYVAVLCAAAHAMFNVTLHGQCKNTLLSLYVKVLGFKVPLPAVCAGVWSRVQPVPQLD